MIGREEHHSNIAHGSWERVYHCVICDACEVTVDELVRHYSGVHDVTPKKSEVYAGRRTVAAFLCLEKCQFCDWTHHNALGISIHEETVHRDELNARQSECVATTMSSLAIQGKGKGKVWEDESRETLMSGAVEVTHLRSREFASQDDRLDFAVKQFNDELLKEKKEGRRKVTPKKRRSPSPAIEESTVSGRQSMTDEINDQLGAWSMVVKNGKAAKKSAVIATQAGGRKLSGVIATQVVMNPGLFIGLRHPCKFKCDLFKEVDPTCTVWSASLYFNCVSLPHREVCTYGKSAVEFKGKFCVYGHPGSRGDYQDPGEPRVNDDALYRGEVLDTRGIYEAAFVLVMQQAPVAGTWRVFREKDYIGIVTVQDVRLPVFGL